MITLIRADNIWDAKPLTWREVNIPAEHRKSALVVCSSGHIGMIDEHAIGPDGVVTPSVVCTELNCIWHEYIKLEGWS